MSKFMLGVLKLVVWASYWTNNRSRSKWETQTENLNLLSLSLKGLASHLFILGATAGASRSYDRELYRNSGSKKVEKKAAEVVWWGPQFGPSERRPNTLPTGELPRWRLAESWLLWFKRRVDVAVLLRHTIILWIPAQKSWQDRPLRRSQDWRTSFLPLP